MLEEHRAVPLICRASITRDALSPVNAVRDESSLHDVYLGPLAHAQPEIPVLAAPQPLVEAPDVPGQPGRDDAERGRAEGIRAPQVGHRDVGGRPEGRAPVSKIQLTPASRRGM